MLYWIGWLGLYGLAPTPSRLKRILYPIFKDEPIDEDVFEISEAIFRLVHIEPEMPRTVRREELLRFKSPTLVIAAERNSLFPANEVIKRAHEVSPNLVAAEIIPKALHFLSPRYHSYLNERFQRFLQEMY